MRLRSAVSELPEIESLERLEKLEEDYARRFGTPPFNISHWDPSPQFEREMLRYLAIPDLQSVIAYTFSYQVKDTLSILKKLGASPDLHHAVITPSNTTSILTVLNWIKSLRLRKLVVCCPSYFTLFQAGTRFGLSLEAAYLRRSEGAFELPSLQSFSARKPSALWITSPVYGAGTYFGPADLTHLEKLLEDGWVVVADECLSLPGMELVRRLGKYPNFVSIYSPHKSVCVNGIKFSAVVFSKRHQDFMERWCDVWYGGLGSSSLLAITHYLSENFDRYATRFLASVKQQRSMFDAACDQASVARDSKAEGHFVTCYYPQINSGLGYSDIFLKTLMDNTGGTVISGNRSRFSKDCGFCFRTNLARKGPQFEPTLHRLLSFLNAQCV